MKTKVFIFLGLPILITSLLLSSFTKLQDDTTNYVAYNVDPKVQTLKFYWKDNKGDVLGNFKKLNTFVESDKQVLIFATNGGMYNEKQEPVGLYIENHKTFKSLNKLNGKGNFHLKPNGVFYVTENGLANICTTENFKPNQSIKYATQSGPMLLIDGEIHPAFTEGSKNLNIGNGVGILPDNSVIFAMSKQMVNFYDFASYFKKLGCKQALYLDGFVSRTYLPEKKWIQTDGNFGVMIAVTKKE